MRKLIATAALLLAMVMAFAMPAYASEVTAEATEEITPTVTEEAIENATEGNVEATEAATEEEVTEAPTEEETDTEPVGIVDGLPAKADRDWLINAIKTAKPDEVEFIKGYIEDALVAMEGKNYTGWEWAYKIVEDNAEWLACLVVGLGFIAAAVVAIVKYRREKILINNSVEAVNIAEKKMEELTAKTDYEIWVSGNCTKLDVNQFKAKTLVHLKDGENYRILNKGRKCSLITRRDGELVELPQNEAARNTISTSGLFCELIVELES